MRSRFSGRWSAPSDSRARAPPPAFSAAAGTPRSTRRTSGTPRRRCGRERAARRPSPSSDRRRRDRLPAPGVEPDHGNAELRGQLEAVLRVLDVLLRARRGRAETKSWWIESIGKERPLRNAACLRPFTYAGVSSVICRCRISTPSKPSRGGVLDHLLDRVLLGPEVPVRICRDRERNAWSAAAVGVGVGVAACSSALSEATGATAAAAPISST